jgi:hypothetical protein
MEIRIGSLFRDYDEYMEWFHEGAVREAEKDYIVVDFGDFWKRFSRDSVRTYYPDDGSYQECLISFEEGAVVKSFNS